MTKQQNLNAINPEAVVNAASTIPPEALLDIVVNTFKALADPTRARILYALIKGPMCVRDLPDHPYPVP